MKSFFWNLVTKHITWYWLWPRSSSPSTSAFSTWTSYIYIYIKKQLSKQFSRLVVVSIADRQITKEYYSKSLAWDGKVWYGFWLTFRKSISWVTSVPSDRWNSSVIRSSFVSDVIVSWTTSPPYAKCRKQLFVIRKMQLCNVCVCGNLLHCKVANFDMLCLWTTVSISYKFLYIDLFRHYNSKWPESIAHHI